LPRLNDAELCAAPMTNHYSGLRHSAIKLWHLDERSMLAVLWIKVRIITGLNKYCVRSEGSYSCEAVDFVQKPHEALVSITYGNEDHSNTPTYVPFGKYRCSGFH